MISELDETIRQVLITEGGIDPNEIDVSFDIPNRAWSGGISRPTVNCYLFDLRENRELRDEGWDLNRQRTASTRQRPALRFNLTYLLTVWTRAVEDEHRLIWHLLQTLARFEMLPVEHLQGALQRHAYPIYAAIARADSVLKSPGEFWGALDNQLKPSINYTITLAMERDAVVAGPPVLTTSVRFQTRQRADDTETLRFGGTLRGGDGAPIGGALVAIDGHAAQATTDAEGRFVLHGLAPGRYALVAHSGARTVRREITVPSEDYDLTLAEARS